MARQMKPETLARRAVERLVQVETLLAEKGHEGRTPEEQKLLLDMQPVIVELYEMAGVI